MALTNIIDGYTIGTGGEAWTTDVDESTSVLLSGSRSIHFKSTAQAPVRLRTANDNSIPVVEGRTYVAWAYARADDITSARVLLRVWWRAADLTAVASTDVYLDELTAADTWEYLHGVAVAPSGARFAWIGLGREDASFNAYFDEVGLAPAVPYWTMSRITSAQSVNDSTDTTVVYNNSTGIDTTPNTGTGVVTIDVAGYYQVNASVNWATMGDQARVQMALRKNGSGAIAILADGGASGTAQHQTTGSFTYPFASGDTLEVVVNQNSGGARNVAASVGTYFTGIRLM